MVAASAPLHPVLACADAVQAAVKDVADVDPLFMSPVEKKAALLGLTQAAARLEELRLRVLVSADDVAEADGARDAAAWLAHNARLDKPATRRELRLGQALQRWPLVTRGLREGSINVAQAAVIVGALDELPADLDAWVFELAEAHMVAQAEEFDPKHLRILGRRLLDVIAPDIAEGREGALLDREADEAARKTFLRVRRNGDGTTDLHLRVADQIADRLLAYLEAFTSPRHSARPAPDPAPAQPARGTHDAHADTSEPPGPQGQPGSAQPAPDDRRSYVQRLGQAFGSFLEAIDPARLPLHGGDATTLIVTIDLETLRSQLEAAGVAHIGDQPISAADARRLACTATILPAVLGGASQVLDLGRSRRLASPAQRKAKAAVTPTCEAVGCDIPAAWCEVHHYRRPWARGGNTDLADLVLLCSDHHHKAHDHRYQTSRADGPIAFHRRT